MYYNICIKIGFCLEKFYYHDVDMYLDDVDM